MTFLPIVARELRVASRRRSTYWMRGAAALAALTGSLWIYALTFREASKETGLILFVCLTVLANLYALLSGLRTTADCLSEEKREGTLGLLFLTDLRGYDIVLGKLAATSLNAFYGLLAMFPILGISVMMGGVTPGEFGRVVLVSINNLLFSLAVGMFFSSLSREDRKSMGSTSLVLLLATALPVVGLILAASHNTSRVPLGFLVPSPSFTVFAAFDVNFGRGGYAGAFWLSTAVVCGFSLLCLAASSLIVPRTWQERTSRGPAGLGERWRQWLYGLPGLRQARRRQLLDINPILWLTSRERFRQALVLGLLAALAGLYLWGYAIFPREWHEMACIPAALLVHTLLKIWFAGEACRRFSEDRRSGALELLLAAPLSVDTLVRGQRLALLRQFGWPVLVALLADGLLMAGGFRYVHSDEGAWAGVWLAGMVMLVWDLHALSWVGPWMGLNSRSPNRATMAALVRICLLPWVGYAAFLSTLALLEAFVRLRLSNAQTEFLFLFTWCALGALANLAFTAWARHRLLHGFREVAMRRFEAGPRHGEWGRVLGEWLGGRR